MKRSRIEPEINLDNSEEDESSGIFKLSSANSKKQNNLFNNSKELPKMSFSAKKKKLVVLKNTQKPIETNDTVKNDYFK